MGVPSRLRPYGAVHKSKPVEILPDPKLPELTPGPLKCQHRTTAASHCIQRAFNHIFACARESCGFGGSIEWIRLNFLLREDEPDTLLKTLGRLG